MTNGVQVATNEKGMALFVVSFVTVIKATNVPGQCNSITFINKGTSTALIGGNLDLSPQQSITIDGNKYEWDNTNYNISFDTTTGTVNKLVIMRKVYQ